MSFCLPLRTEAMRPQAMRTPVGGRTLRPRFGTGRRAATMELQGGKMPEGKVRVRGELAGMFWFAGWLFTLAFAKLLWWQAILALVIWPYYLGVHLR